WSDGEPFTADDILFWYEDIYNNDELHPGQSPDLQIGGKDVVIEKVDQYTVRYVSPVANSLLVERLASALSDLGGPYFCGQRGRGGYAPKHYLQQFHPKYVGQAEVDRMAAEARFEGWVPFFLHHNDWQLDTDLPVVAPWKVTVPANDPTSHVLERNPYSIWVDTEGNQLPYIGTLQHTPAADTEVVALRAAAGEYDFQDLVFEVGKIPVLIENQERGGYRVHLGPQQIGIGIVVNLGYEEDPEIGELFRNVAFRRAISMGIDRDQINEALLLGTGTPGSVAPAPDNKFFPGDEWRTKWATHDPAEANRLLDQIELTDRDDDGFRLLPSGQDRIRLAFQSTPSFADFPAMGE
ncbi:MAG: ABC transporter substrate-binding protein, partial [Acidimicrobiia bacterium]